LRDVCHRYSVFSFKFIPSDSGDPISGRQYRAAAPDAIADYGFLLTFLAVPIVTRNKVGATEKMLFAARAAVRLKGMVVFMKLTLALGAGLLILAML
jgi:hypothetical protein